MLILIAELFLKMEQYLTKFSHVELHFQYEPMTVKLLTTIIVVQKLKTQEPTGFLFTWISLEIL